MCQHHIMLHRNCDHTFHATALCSNVLNHKTCRDPPEKKFPTFSWSGRDIGMQTGWCANCAPIALRVSACLANRGLEKEIWEKLTIEGVRRQLSGKASKLWFAGTDSEYQTCTCCSKMSEGCDFENLEATTGLAVATGITTSSPVAFATSRKPGSS